MRDVAQDFAQAYEAEDGTALGRLLTPRRRSACCRAGSRAGARAWCGSTESQFRAQETQDYSLDDLEVQAGSAGRASGSYRVERKDGEPIEGRIVLGMVRDRGEPRIGLIAVTPRS